MTRRVLVIGYGNPGRLDDGLGPALAAAIEARQIPGVEVEADYQLNVEHAEQIARYDAVVFADASVSAPAPFEWQELAPHPIVGMGSHSLHPSAVLALALDCFGARPRAYALAIRGREFGDFGVQLSTEARRHLDAAIEFLDAWLRSTVRAAGDSAVTPVRNPEESRT